jgi:hypothetical protein
VEFSDIPTTGSIRATSPSVLTLAGSGSTYVYGYCDATYQEGWGEAETLQFVKNSTSSTPPCLVPLLTHQPSRWRWHETGPREGASA